MGRRVHIIWHLAAHAARDAIKTTSILYFDYPITRNFRKNLNFAIFAMIWKP